MSWQYKKIKNTKPIYHTEKRMVCDYCGKTCDNVGDETVFCRYKVKIERHWNRHDVFWESDREGDNKHYHKKCFEEILKKAGF